MAGLFDPTDPTSGGLMGMYTDPNTAAMLGMSQGLLAASGPSRLPVTMGQAMGQGMQGMQQGMGNAFQMQQSLMRMRAIQDALGQGGGSASQSAPQKPLPYTAVTGSADTGGLMGVGAGMGSYGPQQAGVDSANAQQDQQFAQQQAQFQAQNSPMAQYQRKLSLYPLLGIPTAGVEAQMKYDPTLQMSQPTDAQRMAAAAYGYGTPEYEAAIQNQVNKAGYQAPTSIRGQFYADMNGIHALPAPAPEGSQQVPDGQGGWKIVQQQGGPEAVQANAAAKAGGQAQYQTQQVWDPSANNGQGGFVFQSTANIADSANGTAPTNVPVGIRNNNFGNIRGANGGFATYDNPQAGVDAADKLLLNYGAKYGINTISGIANRWSPVGDGNNNPTAKAATIAAASGIPANQPINLSDPAVRSRILPALFDTETPGWRNAIGGNGAPQQPAQQPPQRPGPMAAQPPLGATTATNTAQNASSKQMQDSYNNLSTADSSYQQSRGALTDMLALAHQMGPIDSLASKLPAEYHNINTPVTEYDKAHATFVSNQYNALSAGTDASKGTVNDMVPGSDKPQDAKIAGLNNQLNNLDYRHLETQFMTPSFQKGDQKGYTTLNAQFHNTIKPEMMPLINTLTGFQTKPQLAAAIARVNQQYPQYKKAIDFLGANGMFDGVGQ